MSDVPSLIVERSMLLRELGRHLGWSRDPAAWDERQHADADDIIRRALSQAYYPAPIDDNKTSHVWSFMWPTTTLQTQPNEGDLDLPDDFGGMTEDIRYVNSDAGQWIVKVSVGHMLDLRRRNDNSVGFPSSYALTPKRSEGFGQQRWTLMLDPVPQAAYEISLRYKSDPLAIGDSFPYPLGGQMFSDALVASLIAVADEVLNDTIQGPAWNNFMQKLRTAIYQDRQEHFTGNLGYNGDGAYPADVRRDVAFTINGITPERIGPYFAS